MIISKSYKCPGCGGVLCFDPSQQAMYCEYCDSYWSPVTMKKQNKDKNPIVIHSDEETGVITDVQSYICSSCGGTVYADRNIGATWCPFCRGAIVIDAQFTEDKAPDFIIPFQIDKQTAINSFKSMLKETKWLPKEIFEIDAELNITAIYIPFWFNDFDIEAETEFVATEKSYVASPEHEFVITEKWLVPRSGKIKIRNLPANGSINVDSDIIEAIEPFCLSQCRKFETFYLSGFLAEKYSIDSEATKERALQRAKRDCLNRIGQTIAFYEKVDYKSGKYEVKKRSYTLRFMSCLFNDNICSRQKLHFCLEWTNRQIRL